MRLAAAVALAAVASTAPALAQPAEPAPARKPLPPYRPGPPDAIAVAAGEDANVEPEGGRSGFTLSAAVGPAILVGINKDRATGTGAGFSFRIGRVADRANVVTLELAGVVYPRDYEVTPGVTEQRINQSIIGTWGMQHWVSPAFWIRAGAGLATFTIRTQNVVDESQTRVGGAAVVGTGIDLGRWRSITVGLELMLQSAIYRDGAVFGGGLAFDLSVL